MKSIDNLREYVLTAPSINATTRAILVGYIDAIEREFEQYAVAEIDALPMTDENMSAAGWVRLPLDADGVPIHVGDVMENIVCPPVHREVTGVGVECFYGWDEGNGRYSQFDVACYRHHHAPTVEDVLREFADEVQRCCDTEDTIAEYAEKLRLKEG